MAKKLKQAMVALWFEGSDPVHDQPDEFAGIMQDSLEETQAFASAMLEAHWAGKCGCQDNTQQ